MSSSTDKNRGIEEEAPVEPPTEQEVKEAIGKLEHLLASAVTWTEDQDLVKGRRILIDPTVSCLPYRPERLKGHLRLVEDGAPRRWIHEKTRNVWSQRDSLSMDGNCREPT